MSRADDVNAAALDIGDCPAGKEAERDRLIEAVDAYLAKHGDEVRQDNHRRRDLRRHHRKVQQAVGFPPLIPAIIWGWRVYTWSKYAFQFIAWLMERRVGPPGSDPRSWGSRN